MEHSSAASAFATLGHPGRLAVFRMILRFMPQGARPAEIAATLGMKGNTLSHHLSDLAEAGLVSVERQGRALIYRADLRMTEALIAYLALDVGRARADLLRPLGPPLQSPPPQTPFNVLFVCSGNTARSLIAEALLRDLGAERFRVFSAGISPRSGAHPGALDILARNGHDTRALRPKPLSDLQSPDAPRMDFVFTLCDHAAAEECPPWPGQPVTGHWGLPDPARVTGSGAEAALAFAATYAALNRRIAAFVALPFRELDRIALQSRVDGIGATR